MPGMLGWCCALRIEQSAANARTRKLETSTSGKHLNQLLVLAAPHQPVHRITPLLPTTWTWLLHPKASRAGRIVD